MNNELGRKITSLTLMTIMFAGGITVAGASFMPMAEMPEAIATHGTSSGALSVSSTHIMGGAVLGITINDSAISAVDQQITPPSVDLDGQSVDMTQMSDGTWVAYVVDHETATNLHGALGENKNSSGLEYGQYCDGGLGAQVTGGSDGPRSAQGGAADFDITTNPSFIQGWQRSALEGALLERYCQDTVDTWDLGGLGGQVIFSVLEDPAQLNTNSGTGTNNSGNRNIVVNATAPNASAWPFIQALNFTSSMDTTYGGESVSVNWGSDRDYSISVDRTIVPDNAQVQLTLTDPGLNYDPTSADVWIMDAANETLFFWNNGSVGDPQGQADPQDDGSTITSQKISNDGTQNAVLSTTSLGHVCNNDCTMSVGGTPAKVLGVTTTNAYSWTNVTLTETGNNTGVFTSTSLVTGTEGFSGSDGSSDSSMTLTYGNTVSLIIGYNDASIELEAGDSWLPVETANFTLTDPDANKDTTTAETLNIGDPYDRIPTITIGSPLTLGENVQTQQAAGTGAHASGQQALGNEGVVINSIVQAASADAAAQYWYKTKWDNTTDNSQRLNIIVDGVIAPYSPEEALTTITWVNITTSIAPSEIVDMEGTALISYDITSIADQLGSTDIDFMVTQNAQAAATGGNATVTEAGSVICVESSGNVKAGVFDLDELTGGDDCAPNLATGDYDSAVQRVGVEGITDVWTHGATASQNNFVSYAFKITHPTASYLSNNSTCTPADCYGEFAVAVDIMNFDQDNSSKTHNAIYRMEAVETGADTGVFTGTVAYALMNNSTDQTITSGDPGGSSGFTTGGHSGTPAFVSGNSDPGLTPTVSGSDLVILLGDDGDSPRVSYNDSDVTAAGTIIADQLDVVSHSGTAEFDLISYGSGDTATITINDVDLNQDSSVRETYTNSSGTFQVMINDDDSQVSADQVVIETGADTGVFVGTFVVPDKLGKDMELQYYDSVDATGGDSTIYGVSTIASNLGSVSFDQSSYPVPYNPNGLDEGDNTVMSTGAGPVSVTLSVTEPDSTSDQFTTASVGTSLTAGTIKVKLSGTYVYTAGGLVAVNGSSTAVEELGPLDETERGSQIYEVDFTIGGVDCSSDTNTGVTNTGSCQEGQGGDANTTNEPIPVNATSIMQVEYIDTADAAGGSTTLYDSAIFALHTGSLSVDKDVYIMGQDAVITLTDPDLNRDSGTSEQYDLRLIEWDSSANSSVLLHNSYCTTGCTLDPSNLTETGDNTGVFQTVFTIPSSISEQGGTATNPEMGESVTLTYRDRGLSGENSYGDDELDIEAGFSISKFGAIVELDKAVYDWTDTVVVTITAPDHNNNANSEETIGTSDLPIQANTRLGKMCTTGDKTYTLNETDEDTGVFDGEIAISGFDHTLATSHSYSADANACTGNTGGVIKTAGNMDGITVSYEWVDGSVALASAIIQWNIGEVELLDNTVSPNGSTVIRVTDVDEDLSSTIVDTFKVDVFSDSDSGGFTATVSETGENTGVFEGTIHFADDAATSGLTLRVSEGDTVTVEYTDVTLPGPDYTTSDDMTIAATLTIGTTTPPLERTPAANARVVDAFGSSVAEVSVDQQVQIAADVANAQGKEQAFAYLVQVQDSNGVTVSLAWITGSLNAGQSMSPALSWTPSASGSYTATVFVWESVDNPVALSPTVSVSIDVV